MRSVILISGGALLVSALLATNPAGLREEFHHSYALSARGRVALENVSGNIRITAWDRDEVRVDAVKHAASRQELDDARILVDAQPDAVMIRTRYPDSNLGRHPASVEYTLMVPRGARLDQVKLVSGGIEIKGVTGEVRASSVNGAVHAEQLAGDARLSTVNGRLEASFDRLDAARAVTLHSVNGNITLSIPFDAHAELSARNVTGGIRNGFGLEPQRGPFAGSRLETKLKGGGTHIRLENVSGSISIVPVAGGKPVKFT